MVSVWRRRRAESRVLYRPTDLPNNRHPIASQRTRLRRHPVVSAAAAATGADDVNNSEENVTERASDRRACVRRQHIRVM